MDRELEERERIEEKQLVKTKRKGNGHVRTSVTE